MSPTLNLWQAPEHQPFLCRGPKPAAALLVHGFPGTPDEMRPAANVLQAAGWTVQGVLLPGFGLQIGELANYSQSEWVQSVRSSLTILQAEYKTVILIGNSMGAALALQIAAHQPPTGLILFAPFWRSANKFLDFIIPVARRFVRKIRPFQKADFKDAHFREGFKRITPDANLDDPAVQAVIRQISISIDVLGQVRRAGQLGYQAAPQVKLPVLILQGTKDSVALPAFTRQIAHRLPNLAGYFEVEGDHELSRAKTAWPLISALIQQFARNLEISNTEKTSA